MYLRFSRRFLRYWSYAAVSVPFISTTFALLRLPALMRLALDVGAAKRVRPQPGDVATLGSSPRELQGLPDSRVPHGLALALFLPKNPGLRVAMLQSGDPDSVPVSEGGESQRPPALRCPRFVDVSAPITLVNADATQVQVFDNSGGPGRTRICDLYRVKVGISITYEHSRQKQKTYANGFVPKCAQVGRATRLCARNVPRS